MSAPPRDSQHERALRASLEKLAQRTLAASVLSMDAIPAGLGSRRFYRLQLDARDPASVIARVHRPEDPSLRPPGVDPEPQLEPLRSFLEANAIPVPRSFATDDEHGIELLEDLGPTSLEDIAAQVSREERIQLYGEACEIVARLQKLQASPDEIPAFGRHLGAPLFRYKAEQVIEWTLPWSLGRPADASEASVVREAFDAIAQECSAAPQRLSHRDYKGANLHVRPKTAAGRRLVLIDLQGALLAPPEYDFVCLLRDPHVSLPADEVAGHLERAQTGLSKAERQEFARRFCLLTLTRVAKDLSRYLFAAHRRSDLRYLPLLPEAARSLRSAAALASGWSPQFERLADLFGRLPADWSEAHARASSEKSCGR